MLTRRVYSTADLATARAAVRAAQDIGLDDERIALLARSDIELDVIPRKHRQAETDFMPAAFRGALWGGAVGLGAGLVAVFATNLQPEIAIVGVATMMGALVGTWASSLAGSTLPDPVRQKFDGEIQAGRILLVVDAAGELLERADAAVQDVGATPLPFDATTAAVR